MKLTVEGEGFKFELTGHFADIWPEMFRLLWESNTVFGTERDTDWSEPVIEILTECQDELLCQLGMRLIDFKMRLKNTDKNISDSTLSDFIAFVGHRNS